MTTREHIVLIGSVCGGAVFLFAGILAMYAHGLKIKRMFRPDVYIDLSVEFKNVTKMHEQFTIRRRGDFFDRWAEDIARKMREKGIALTVVTGLWDVLTLGGSARRRARVNELQAAGYLAQSIEYVNAGASDNLRKCVASTATRIQYGFKLLRLSQRITNPLESFQNNQANPILVRRIGALNTRTCNLVVRQAEFVEIATAAGAGTATAIGLWGAVQVAGYASTGTAMSGLYGAAAHNAGWAWFGGGSLAMGHGGMALGHVVLPGVGIAVGWATLVAQLYRSANKLEIQLQEIERWNDTSMPVLTNMMAVEEKYRSGAEDFRSALEDLDFVVRRANKKLRRFRVLSDWRRKVCAKRGKPYYSLSELDLVDGVASSVDRFLSRLPVSHIQHD